ncbi:Hpt domain-containing protein [Solemya velum gill symbiont]|uniref:Hpt domain-containing protein n=1 Tax=Solemya velum gill symbiont TaxID=2340 RepID=UPI000997676C|nr:Hpt domain-containing protein [Solemya velum gill symbiont]OOZ43299.1 hypothetical protein BOW37_11635 [Solemya velum gill symbiont]OOZ44292.1 hypothetical protein BOW38_11720 [Solemya velum gill symbiont]OOZ48064.1 hypothetical protein BOW39_12640 [Solemya velum gill symbiont]OOZ49545.1 hypothetical protein BOW40_11670 [Solemya velum gill symbiont]OOZ53084.1 hypothetical protein BOW41_11820 [Solemya velum gill symbiont]
MNDYLAKPMQLQQLQEALMQWFPNSAKTEVAPRSLKQEDLPEAVIDSQVLPSLLGIQDQSLLADFYNEFVESSAETVAEIHAALGVNELVEVGLLAHRMKSTAKTVGADELAACCLTLELAGKQEQQQDVESLVQHLSEQFVLVQDWIEHYKDSIVDQ